MEHYGCNASVTKAESNWQDGKTQRLQTEEEAYAALRIGPAI
jgi:hypothetical protein